MNHSPDPFYSLAPGVDAVPLGNGQVLFRSDTLAIRLEGEAARLLAEQVLPLLDGQHPWAVVAAAVPGIDPADLRRHLDALVDAGVLRRGGALPAAVDAARAPFLLLLESLGRPAGEARARLAALRVAIAGLEGPGAHLAAILAQCGVGHLTLIDPYPCQAGNLALLPGLAPNAVGRPRQEALAAALRQALPDAPPNLELGPTPITRESLAALAPGYDLLVGCFDRGFSSAQHWLNRASLASGVPAIYAEARGHLAWAGPLVLPGATACYMCYRMRSIAGEEDFVTAMAYEEFLDGQKQPALHTRAVLPTLPPYLASLLAADILKVLLGLDRPALADKMLEFNGLTLATEVHPVLQHPDCPVCGVKKKGLKPHPPLAELLQATDPPTDILALAPRLLSKRTGIIDTASLYLKDAGEPVLPYIYCVSPGNHRFRPKETEPDMNCSGKGMTLDAARAGALGEAVERYSSDWLDPDEVVYGRQGDLDGPSVDPRALVLYTPEQYTRLPYAPYQESTVLGWVRARSLVTDARVYVPAQMAFMGYDIASPAEYLIASNSNGMAAGATLAHAILAATYEVLERDAFLITWYNRLPTTRIDPAIHPDADIRHLCQAYARRQVEIQLHRLPTDHPCAVFMALGLQAPGTDGPMVIVGLGADLDPVRAARKAILETGQIRPSYRQTLRRASNQARVAELIADPMQVNDMHDHGLLYASPLMRPALAFLTMRPVVSPDWTSADAGSPAANLARLVAWCRETDQDLLYYNLTPPDMARLGLHTVRAILPGFQPMAFGAQEARLAGTRLYELPYRLGFTAAPTTLADLNPDPHPLD